MTSILRTAWQVKNDALSAMRLGRTWKDDLRSIASQGDESARRYLLSKHTESGPKGYIGQAFYDINGGTNPVTHANIGSNSAEILMLYRLCDDTVDAPGYQNRKRKI